MLTDIRRLIMKTDKIAVIVFGILLAIGITAMIVERADETGMITQSGDGPLVIEFNTDPNCIIEITVAFNYADGKFDVVYDANDLSGAADTFFTYMLPYLNEHIEAKAEELLKIRNVDNPVRCR